MRRTWLAVVALLGATACGVLPGSQPAPSPTPAATVVAPTLAASPTRPASAASPTAAAAAPKPTAAPEPSGAANTVYVGNTDGEGVYIRKTPNMDDKLKAYPDGTALTIIGDDVDNADQHWKHVRAPDGTEGYVPAMYTTDSAP
jgi:hypothetical protein